MYIWLASPKPSELFYPVGHPFLSSFALLFVHSVAIVSQPFSTLIYCSTSLGLTLLPIHVPVAPRPTRERLDSELTLSPPAVLTDWLPSISTPSACRSLSMPFRSGLSPSPCSINHAYLPGLLSARPSAFVEGEGFEPPMSCITLYYQLKDASVDNCRRCFRPLSQPSFVTVPCGFPARSRYLSSFMSSYTPLRMFIAISCCGYAHRVPLVSPFSSVTFTRLRGRQSP